MKDNLKKEFFWNTLGSGLASFVSLFFMIIVTRINGTNVAGVFTLTFASALMFYALGLYSGRTYQVTETNKKIVDDDFVKHRFITAILMVFATFIFGLINGYRGTKFLVLLLLCIAKAIEALSDVYHGILQKNKRLDIVGISLFIRSILEVIIFIIVDLITHNIIITSLSLVLTNFLVFLLIDMRYGNKYKENKVYKIESIKEIFIFGFFTFGISFIANYLYNIPRYALDGVVDETLQAIYGIIVMPATIIMVVNMFIIQPLIVTLKEIYAKREKKRFINLIIKIIGITLFIGCFALLGTYLFGVPILELVYGVELNDYLISLLLIIVGATFYTISSVFQNSMIIIRKTRIQFVIYIIVSIIAYIVSNCLVGEYAFDGAVYSYLIMMIILMCAYISSFIINISDKDLWRNKNERKN